MTKRAIDKRLQRLERASTSGYKPDQIRVCAIEHVYDDTGRIWVRASAWFDMFPMQDRQSEWYEPTLEEEPWRLRDDER